MVKKRGRDPETLADAPPNGGGDEESGSDDVSLPAYPSACKDIN
jgi:hypothetical protein